MKRTTRLAIGAALLAWMVNGALAQVQYFPGQVIYDFSSNDANDPNSLNTCYPDDWTFFGISQTDFGADADAEDGFGAFQVADWDLCDALQGPNTPGCQWAGCAIGVGLFHHPQCEQGGVTDANIDVSLGTGLSIRMRVDPNAAAGGTLGARVQLQLTDVDGTNAVSPRKILANPAVNRMAPLAGDWITIKFPFAGLDWAWDNDDAAAGGIPGLNLEHIKTIKLIWRREAATGVNAFEFDQITLIDDPVTLWADEDGDGDVDMADMASAQVCLGGPLTGPCDRLDADFDEDLDANDWLVLEDCIQGPNVTADFFAWAY